MRHTREPDPRRVEIGAAAAFLQSVAQLVEEPLRFAS